MESDIKNDLRQAKKEYNSKNYSESLQIFEKVYSNFSEAFEFNDMISYCWAIYQVHVKKFSDEDELFEAAETICDMIPQADLNNANTCPYTFSVFRVLDFLKNQKEYYNMSYWTDKLNPDLLDEKRSIYYGQICRSRKEKYYDYLSKSLLECAEWEECIEISNEALQSLTAFTNNGDVWHHWRIAKSLRELNKSKEALIHLENVIGVKKEWFVYKEFIENYYLLDNTEKALEYVPGAVLSDGLEKSKVNLHYLIYKLLNDSNQDIAFKHAEVYYLIKLENNSEVAADIEELYIDEDNLDKGHLVSEIKNYWSDFKNVGQLKSFYPKMNFENSASEESLFADY